MSLSVRSVASTPARPLSRLAANSTTPRLDASSDRRSSIGHEHWGHLSEGTDDGHQRRRRTDTSIRCRGRTAGARHNTRSTATRCTSGSAANTSRFDFAKEVGHGAVRQHRLRFPGPRRQDAKTTLTSPVHRGEPQRRLPYPGLTRDDQTGTADSLAADKKPVTAFNSAERLTIPTATTP